MKSRVEVRSYQPEDREKVRRICCETGFQGNPVDPLFQDRDLFADAFTRYHTDYEPQHASVAVVDSEVVGYLLGSLHWHRYWWIQHFWLGPRMAGKAVIRLMLGRYNQSSRQFLAWFLTRASRETPKVPPRSAHFHINFLPSYRDGVAARRLIFPFVEGLPALGIRRVFGQIQTRDDRRPPAVFARYGFHLYDQRRLTRFERFDSSPVYVSTYVKEW